MLKVSIFIRDFDGGGAEKVMLNLANGFANNGTKIRVDLVFVELVGPYVSHISPQVQVFELGKTSLSKSFIPLVQYLKSEKPDILISALEDTNIIAIYAAKLAAVGVKVIVTIHNHLSSEIQNAKQLKRKIVPHLLRFFYPSANHIVAVSEGVATDVAKWSRVPRQAIKVIYNPIVEPNLHFKQNSHLDHPWLNNQTTPVILGIGRLDRQKDFSTLIRAFSQARKDRELKLIILGEGKERNNLEQLIHELELKFDIDLLGFVDNPHAYIKRSDLLVLSSAWEGFGNVLVEAMAAGTPVVSTDCPSGPSEILDQGIYGQLVPVGNADIMSSAIINSLDNPIASDTLKSRASRFSIERALYEYQRLF